MTTPAVVRAPSERMRELDFFLGAWEAPGVIMLRTVEPASPRNPVPRKARYLLGYDAGTAYHHLGSGWLPVDEEEAVRS